VELPHFTKGSVMLSNASVLETIKFSLGYPFTEIELLDSDIIYRAKNVILKRYFSQYVPVFKYQVIYTTDPNVQTASRTRYKILDPDDAGILSVFDVITDNEIIMSLNIMGSNGLSYSDLPNWYSNYYARATQMLTTNWYSTFEFVHPNFIDIRPGMTLPKRVLVCYEAQHTMFETIPAYRESLFLDLAIGYIKLNIAEIRSKYQTIETQFGEIKLNWDTIKADGKELYDATMVKLEKIPPRVVFDAG